MRILVEENNDINAFLENIDKANLDVEIKGIMILICDDDNLDVKAINEKLSSLTKPVFGGIFPAILHSGKSSNKGSLVIGFNREIIVEVFENIESIEDENKSYMDELEDKMTKLTLEKDKFKTISVYLDGLSAGVDRFKEQLFYNIGLDFNYFGGGAGSLTFERRPCVITNKGILSDSAVIALFESISGVGVAHGWTAVSEAIKVTEVDKNRIISLNWKPAFEVYKNEVEKISSLKFAENNFFDIAKSYPFGITRIGNEMIVRDPIEVKDDGTIICVGELPKNSFVYILNGNKESLVNGARHAKQIAIEGFKKLNVKDEKMENNMIFIDCISRVLFLGDDFQDEIDAIDNLDMVGALTIGEIANTGKSYLELYNKTSVVAILED